MTLGTRAIGTRTLGDGTGDSGMFRGSGVTITDTAVTLEGSGTLAVQFPINIAWSVSGSGSLQAAPATAISWTQVRMEGMAAFGVTVPPKGKAREFIAVDMAGNPIGAFGPAAVPGPVTWELNAPDEYSFGLVACSEKAGLVLDEKVREVQLWRGDQMLTWGPMMRPRQVGPGGNILVEGADPRRYFQHRFIGRADRTNYVVNGNFEDGLAGWNFDYAVQEPIANRTGANISYGIATDRVFSKTRSLRTELTSPTIPEWGFFAGQIFVWSVDPAENPQGDDWSAVVRVYIPSASWVGPGPENIGLRLGRYSTTETVSVTPPGGSPILVPKPIEGRDALITEDTPRDTWVTLNIDLLVPLTGDPEYVQFTLGFVRGVAYYDLAMLARKETLSFFGVDQALIVKGIGEHLQSPAYDKTDLNVGFDTPLTGKVRDRVYVLSEHPPGYNSMTEFNHLDDGLDIGMRFTPTTRTLYTAYPSQGRFQPNLTLALGRNIASYDYVFDGEAAATSVIELGEGFGSTREEGFALDTSTFANGVVLERLSIAPPETPVDSLDHRAAETLEIARDPEIVTVVTYPDTDLIGRLGLGDTLRVDIREGSLAVNNIYRAVRITLRPDDSLEVVLNRRGEP